MLTRVRHTAISVLALAVLALVMGACGGGSQTPETTVTTLEDIFGLLRENGYEVTNLNETSAGLIGASRGFSVIPEVCSFCPLKGYAEPKIFVKMYDLCW